MNASDTTTFTLPAPGGGDGAFVRRWDSAGEPRAVVIVAHGVSEHSERYDRLARALAARGYRTYASDHRGHGRSAAGGRLGDAGPGGWTGILEDLEAVRRHARAEAPGVPVFLLGHSMGSMLAQRFIASHGAELAGVVLSGAVTSFVGSDEILAAAASAARDAPEGPSQLFLMLFAGFNEPFEAKTGFEWLSRDADEVRKYVDDPLSGNPLSNATLADFLPGWVEASSDGVRARVPHGLPVLLLSGARDSAGDDGAAPRELAAAYREQGLRDVTLTLYPQARHEIFNETNRDQVIADLLAWLDARVAAGTAARTP